MGEGTGKETKEGLVGSVNKEEKMMTVAELRFIVRQLPNYYLSYHFDEYWISDPLLEKALVTMLPVFSNRLNKFIGTRREEWKNLVLPKKGGGDMKPGYANACYGLKAALRSLWWALCKFKKEAKATLDRENQKLTCPHCGMEVVITVSITQA